MAVALFMEVHILKEWYVVTLTDLQFLSEFPTSPLT